MTAKIIDGKAIAQLEQEKIAATVAKMQTNGQRPPGLAVILVGQDPASQLYVERKRHACQAVGFYSEAFDFPSDISADVLLQKIDELNASEKIDGILVQLPLPSHIPSEQVLERIAPHKDVDGFHAYNMGKLVQGQPGLRPCTPHGVMTLIAHTGIELNGCEACIVGASRIVGRPMAIELLNAGATVTICHRFTKDLQSHLATADLVVVGIGQPQFIQGEWMKKGAVIIDVGTNRLPNGKLVGDVDYDSASKIASWITPVPGGVGPMTVATLLSNTLLAAQLAQR
ncbi:bifunctional methylenetetrahydrofolate dehydrogenase/methenyltetrahydrofolate cyclohydrolase FolD [Candidatus Berkiella aquae]|uniref:Bifunctional protein FolD n=1 Tax=Candidatus Berkiella aquae TaxID=295108 RepID=A0A0Q9YIC6_9GAMM|nr:bifunctional methylenetetrahydrofolate dehydrogenase/methenyltetrahydrofolate cyclohydrolase FolD [Candidatus Berkiella aquae]MCS5711729.1 bifunctional methylenetetrahydrofolate dehydrogenase/methenyltetrahydrofolate cyclohydrolase FolD [Candidatus Berkiella aquae]